MKLPPRGLIVFSGWLRSPAAVLYLLCGITPALLLAQVAPSPAAKKDDDRVLELSPFTVRADQDEGYRARNTLAGSRLNASLADIPAQISVMTTEFLNDVGAVNPEDAFKYSLNVEGVDEYQSSGEADDYASGTLVNLDRARVRGLSSPAFTQGFFVTKIRHDNYNIERITFASGPNAVIYGLGAPGGIVDTQLKSAQLGRRFGEAQVRVDSEGGYRASLDFNQPLLPGRLALRGAILHAEEKEWQKPSRSQTDRAYLTLQAKLAPKTNVRAYFEKSELDVLAPLNTAWFDAVTPWIAAGRPVFDNGLASTQQPTQNYWQYIGSNGRVWAINSPAVPIVPWNGNAAVTTSHVSRTYPIAFEQGPFALPVGQNILNRELNLRGNGSRMLQEAKFYGVVADQRVGENLNFELGYNYEEGDVFSSDPIAQEFAALRADPNKYLPDRVTPNPNVGKLYVEGVGRVRQYTDLIEEFRGLATYRLDLTPRSPWLGEHNLTALLTRVESTNSRNTSDMRIVPDGLDFATVVNNYNEGGRYTGGFRYYLDEAGLARGSEGAAVAWPIDTIFGGPTGKGSTVWGVDNPYGSTFLPTYTRSINRSAMAALQSYFWNKRIITTAGWRRTEVRTIENQLGQRGSGTGNAAFNNIDDLNPANNRSFEDAGDQNSLGIVVAAKPWLRFFYNAANTWDSPLGIHNLDDSRISAPVGKGRDFGVMVSALDDKLFLRVNFFKNEGGPIPTQFFQDKVLWRIWFIEQMIKPLNGWQEGWGLRRGTTPLVTSRDANGNVIPMPSLGGATFDTAPFPDYLSVTSDQEARGVEIELTANWPKNWQFQWSFSKQEVSEKNIGRGVRDYVDLRFDHWKQWALWERGLPNYASTYADNWTFINPAFNFMSSYLGLMAEVDGRSNVQGRQWRSNLTARYNFTQGALKGLYAGATVRYRGKSVIGYGTKTTPNPYPGWPGASATITVPDITRPIYGTDLVETDAFVAYRRPILAERYELKLQLNIRNLFDDDDIIAQKAVSTGQIVNYAYKDPRMFVFTTTLGF
jgi:iron complex outermembrane receptor protein